MLKYISLLAFLCPQSFGVEAATTPVEISYPTCKENPIYCQVLKNRPGIAKQYALELATLINKLSNEFNIKPKRLAAILAQESRYKLDAINKKTKDYGIAQINHKTIDRYGFDKERLLTDLEYSVKAGAIVLADLKKGFAHKEEDYWCRYNAGTAHKEIIEERCDEYKRLVARFM